MEQTYLNALLSIGLKCKGYDNGCICIKCSKEYAFGKGLRQREKEIKNARIKDKNE
jgi:hypothetical protein